MNWLTKVLLTILTVFSIGMLLFRCGIIPPLLGEAENVIFWVFDLPRVITCPGRTTICLERCYQKDVVKMHKEPRIAEIMPKLMEFFFNIFAPLKIKKGHNPKSP